jgi:hypothetical protein
MATKKVFYCSLVFLLSLTFFVLGVQDVGAFEYNEPPDLKSYAGGTTIVGYAEAGINTITGSITASPEDGFIDGTDTPKFLLEEGQAITSVVFTIDHPIYPLNTWTVLFIFRQVAPQQNEFVSEMIRPESSTTTLSYHNLNITERGWYIFSVSQTQFLLGTHTYEIQITVEETTPNIPVASAGGPYLVALGYAIQLDGTCVYPDVQEPLTFLWTPADNIDDATLVDPTYNTYFLAAAGIEELTFVCEDSEYNSGADSTMVVVYDPDGGFVTGGGWIWSETGYCQLDDICASASGKANFGFISKYKKGASTPTGQTEFQFKAGDLNFHSDSYEWLVVAGAKAMYKGVGTINGEGNYGFMLMAIDAELTPSTDVDLFRIKIWDKDAGDSVVYDNEMDEVEDADLTTAIGGGNIKVHKGN